MKFYKLELINREQSYNQMFGTNPNIGVMNPVVTAKAGVTGKAPMVATGKQPSMGVGAMGLGGMGISGGAPATAAALKDQGRGQKSRLV